MTPSRKAIWTAAFVTMVAAGCDKDDSPSEPSNGMSAATITISNNTVSPRNVTVPLGSQVTFTNNDSIPHNMASDPHPNHNDCPPINNIGLLNPVQSRQTANFTTARTCGYHDHDRDTIESLKGTITIQ